MTSYEHRIVLNKSNYVMKDLHFKNCDVISKELFYKELFSSKYKINVVEYTKDYGDFKEHLTVFNEDLAMRL